MKKEDIHTYVKEDLPLDDNVFKEMYEDYLVDQQLDKNPSAEDEPYLF